ICYFKLLLDLCRLRINSSHDRPTAGFESIQKENGMASGDTDRPLTVLSLEGGEAQPLSIRAKALVFSDPASRRLLDYVELLARSEAPVLVFGETGTGKELIARHIHQLSGRKGPFLAV